MELKMLLIPSCEVMDSFCYSYAKALVNKLCELEEKKRVFEPGRPASAGRHGVPAYELTRIAYSVISELQKQISYRNFTTDTYSTEEELQQIIETAKKFLAIFEK